MDKRRRLKYRYLSVRLEKEDGMNEALVRLMAEHHGMQLRDDLVPQQDDLDDEPDMQPVGTVTDTHIRWLFGIAYQAAERHAEQVERLKDTAEERPRQIRVTHSLAVELMMAFKRCVRERFGIHDDADLAVTRDWKVYTWAKRPGHGCGGCGGGCGGCGNDEEEAKEAPTESDPPILLMLSPESYAALMRTGVYIVTAPTIKADPDEEHVVRMLIPASEELYHAMRTSAPLIAGLCQTYEQVFGWSHEVELSGDEEPAEDPDQGFELVDEDDGSEPPEVTDEDYPEPEDDGPEGHFDDDAEAIVSDGPEEDEPA